MTHTFHRRRAYFLSKESKLNYLNIEMENKIARLAELLSTMEEGAVKPVEIASALIDIEILDSSVIILSAILR